jgi:uncharacterized protein YhbP (UPF0306 family)
MTREELERTVILFMDSFTTMTLACCSNHEPWVAAVYYARQGFDLIFFSSSKSRHSMFFSQNPRAAASIHGDYKGWKEIKGLQMEGKVEALTTVMAQAKATAIYVKRYPFVRDFIGNSVVFSRKIAEQLKQSGVRVDLKEEADSLGKKIRNAEAEKVPYMLIAGEEDQLAGKVSIRYRSGEQKNGIAVADAIAEIQGAIRDRKQV